MEQTVYADLLFFVNFCMDFQCLFLTAKLLHRPFSIAKGTIFSALGAIYACAALFLATNGIAAFLADCSVCFLMCLGTFGGKRVAFWHAFVAFGLYFGVSLAMGGIMSGMASLLSHLSLPLGESENVSSWLFFLLAGVGAGATLLWGRFCQRRAKGQHALLRFAVQGRECVVRSVFDSGNLLNDPVSGRPVVLLELSAGEEIFNQGLLRAIQDKDTAALTALPHDIARRVRLIPAGSATGQGLLFAIVPDSAVLDMGRGEVPVEILLAPIKLFGNTDDYQALLPAELLAQ